MGGGGGYKCKAHPLLIILNISDIKEGMGWYYALESLIFFRGGGGLQYHQGGSQH